jgi:hypothetical protein
MILDSAKVSLTDGTQAEAISVFPGRDLLSFHQEKPARSTVADRTVRESPSVMGLVLSNGQRFCGSEDQEVALYRNHRIRFVRLRDVMIGDTLRGERAGRATVVKVAGLVFYPPTKPQRLVGFDLDKVKNFVADGVLCK